MTNYNASCGEHLMGKSSEKCTLLEGTTQSCFDDNDISEDRHDVTFMREFPNVKYQFSVLSKEVA